MEIRVDRVFQRIGQITSSGTYADLSYPNKVKSTEFGVVLAWPKQYPFLMVQAEPCQAEPTQDLAWQSGPAGVTALFHFFHRTDATDAINELADCNLLSGRLRRGQSLLLTLTVNTDHDHFVELAERISKGQHQRSLPLRVVLIDQTQSEEPSVELVLEPCTEAQKFNGFVAIDLGNTNSTLAALNAGGSQRDQISSVRVLPDLDLDQMSAADMRPDHKPVVSMVRVEKAFNVSKLKPEDQTTALTVPTALSWRVGKWAICDNRSPDGVIVGPKRWVARPPGGPKFPIWTADNHRPSHRVAIPLDNWVPAELFVCRLIQGFQASQRRQPRTLAITYPTSYSSRELKQLREAVFRAVRRSRLERQDEINSSAIDKLIPLSLDEASAAAFFFLYRRIFEPTGGLRRFRYLYPFGFNLLLYDCGGGTTDIALVRAHSPENERLCISVLGRAALRDFGGDDVTIAVYRLLKAKLAKLIYSSEDPRPRDTTHASDPGSLPDGRNVSRESLERYFYDKDECINQIVPTRFRPRNANQEDLIQQKRALALWEWAERVKDAFASGALDVKDRFLKDDLTETLCTPPDDRKKREALYALQKRVIVSRAEVDALVRQQVLDSRRLCNNLIHSKLRSRSDIDDAQVHLVCLAGNGCRYPLVRELLRSGLEVPFVDHDDDRFLYDEQHLKHAVAKGAVLALASQEAGQLVRIEFDSSLHNRLPFDVGYRDDAAGAARLLYAEGTLYTQLEQPVTVETPVFEPGDHDERANHQRFVSLVRRWPGEGKHWWPFLTFFFQHPIKGSVKVSYSPYKHDFVVEHDGEYGQRPPDDPDDQYLAPVQRGKL